MAFLHRGSTQLSPMSTFNVWDEVRPPLPRMAGDWGRGISRVRGLSFGGLSVVDGGLSVVDGGHPAPQEADLTTTTTSACVPLATKNRKQTGE